MGIYWQDEPSEINDLTRITIKDDRLPEILSDVLPCRIYLRILTPEENPVVIPITPEEIKRGNEIYPQTHIPEYVGSRRDGNLKISGDTPLGWIGISEDRIVEWEMSE